MRCASLALRTLSRLDLTSDLIRMILTMNNFTFNDKHYLQIHGTAMGTRMAPSYANLFLAKFETVALSRASYQPHTWWRYIDDIFMIWTHSVDDQGRSQKKLMTEAMSMEDL